MIYSILIYIVVLIILLALIKKLDIVTEDHVVMSLLWPFTLVTYVSILIFIGPVLALGYIVEYIVEELNKK